MISGATNATSERQLHIGVNTLFLIPGEVGGTETYLTEVLKSMCTQAENVRFTLFTNNENHSKFRELFSSNPHVELCRLKFNASNRIVRILREQTELPLLARSRKVDVIWSPGYVGPHFTRCKTVVTIHDMQYRRFPEDLTFLSRSVLHFLVSAASRRSDGILTVSHFSKSEIVRFTGVEASRIAVTTEAADSQFRVALDKAERDKLLESLIGHDVTYVLCVANSYPHKNLSLLIRSFALLKDAKRIKLVIVGKKRLGETQVAQSLSELPPEIARNIVRLESVTQKELMALYQGSAVFAFPSLYEGFGLPILEALSGGCLVCALKVASIPEVSGDCVLYANSASEHDFAAAITKLLELEETTKEKMKLNARLHASSFNWSHCATSTLQFLRQVFETRTNSI